MKQIWTLKRKLLKNVMVAKHTCDCNWQRLNATGTCPHRDMGSEQMHQTLVNPTWCILENLDLHGLSKCMHGYENLAYTGCWRVFTRILTYTGCLRWHGSADGKSYTLYLAVSG